MSAEKLLQNFLNKLKENTGISSATLITEDGLMIASDDETSRTLDRMAHLVEIGAISAGILSMAERSIKLISDKNLSQIVLKGGKDTDQTGVTAILTAIYENIILLVIFPSRLNIGLIFYEIESVTLSIKKFMKENENRIVLHPESVL